MNRTITLTEEQVREVAVGYLDSCGVFRPDAPLNTGKRSRVDAPKGSEDLSSIVRASRAGEKFYTRQLAETLGISGHKASRQLIALKGEKVVKMIQKGVWKRI